MATPTDPDGEFLTPVPTMEARLRYAQRVLLGVHAPFSDMVAKPDRFDPAAIDRIRVLIEALDQELRNAASVTQQGGWDRG